MYRLDKKITSNRRLWLAVVAVVAVAIVGVVWRLRDNYEHNLQPLSTAVVKSEYFTVNPGAGLHQIAVDLQSSRLIRSWSAFEWYVRSNELRDRLQAGTYSLKSSMSVPEIARMMASGKVAKNLLTILPGTRLDQVEQAFTKAGYSRAEVIAALSPTNYTGHPALNSLPSGRSLEGYLYPDSFQKTLITPATMIVRASLDELNTRLTPQIRAGFKKHGLNINQGIILASIVEQESSNPKDSPIIAQVFLSRLRAGMTLGSDVTAKYASIQAGVAFSPSVKSAYNTRLVKGLPPGPIGTVSAVSLSSAANPANTSYLYFVTGDNGTTYFSYTGQQHETLVQTYCIKACN